MKLRLLAAVFLGTMIAACSDGTTQTSDGGAGGDETGASSSSSSSSGMGGAGGNGMSSSSSSSASSSSSGGGVSAKNLGQVCNPAMPCPMGYTCVQLQAMATNGFCTIPCTGVADMMSCSQANQFPGPGLGACVVQIQGQMGMFCGVVCGAQYSLPDMCPAGLTCKDTLDAATKMPGMDGKTDFCVP